MYHNEFVHNDDSIIILQKTNFLLEHKQIIMTPPLINIYNNTQQESYNYESGGYSITSTYKKYNSLCDNPDHYCHTNINNYMDIIKLIQT